LGKIGTKNETSKLAELKNELCLTVSLPLLPETLLITANTRSAGYLGDSKTGTGRIHRLIRDSYGAISQCFVLVVTRNIAYFMIIGST